MGVARRKYGNLVAKRLFASSKWSPLKKTSQPRHRTREITDESTDLNPPKFRRLGIYRPVFPAKSLLSSVRGIGNYSKVLVQVKESGKIIVTEKDVIEANNKLMNSTDIEKQEMYERNKIDFYGKEFSLLLPDDKLIKKLIRQDF